MNRRIETPEIYRTPSIQSALSSYGKRKRHREEQSPVAGPEIATEYVAAVVEYRATSIVGIAIMSTSCPKILLYQFQDQPMFDLTIHTLSQYEPRDILFADTATHSPLYSLLQKRFDLAAIHATKRKYFDDSEGTATLEQLATPSSMVRAEVQKEHFLCLAAANSILKFHYATTKTQIAPQTLSVSMKTLDSCVQLDTGTIRHLPLLGTKQVTSLFNVLDHCKTPMGRKALYTSLMQPYNSIDAINERLDAVEAILASEEFFYKLGSMLSSVNDLNHINRDILSDVRGDAIQVLQRNLASILRLKDSLVQYEPISACLCSFDSAVLQSKASSVWNTSSQNILHEIQHVLSDNATLKCSSSENLQTQLTFCVKPGIHAMLDIARSTYCELVQSIERTAQGVMEDTHGSKMTFSKSRGYHLYIPTKAETSLLCGCIDIVRKGKRIYFTTDALLSLENKRMSNYHNVLELSNMVLADLLRSIRSKAEWLIHVSETLGEVDLLLSFAEYAALRHTIVRPIMEDQGPIAVKQGRHPILDHLDETTVVPNDVFLTPSARSALVMGANGGGKSTLLTQIGLLSVMAHIGCFVPATYAQFPRLLHIMTQLSNTDEQEHNMGTFLKECSEISFICRHVTPRSLVLVDEFGRGTSPTEAVGLAWALIEYLTRQQCYVLFATHLHDLLLLAASAPQTRLIRFDSTMFPSATMQHTYRAIEESTMAHQCDKDYGIRAAQSCGFPQKVMEEATDIAQDIRGRKATLSKEDEAVHECVTRLRMLVSLDLTEEHVNEYVDRIKETIQQQLQQAESAG